MRRFDVTGIPIDALGPGQSGRVIAEKKVSLVGQQVEELLGYGADQFRQIVLLPQVFETLRRRRPTRGSRSCVIYST